MNPLRFLQIFIMFSVWIPIQSRTVQFSYDEAGNRIKREIIITRNNMPEKTAAGIEQIEDELSDKNVTIASDQNHMG